LWFHSHNIDWGDVRTADNKHTYIIFLPVHSNSCLPEKMFIIKLRLYLFATFNTRQDLENYIRNHPEARLARIQNLAKELTDVDVMPGTVQAEAEGLTARWSQLSQKVSTLFLT
jgi:hypothetical protein